MNDAMMLRLAGASAVLGGVLRAAAAAPNALAPDILNALYFVTDVFLIFGLIGVFAKYRRTYPAATASGFAMALFGLLVVRSAGFGILGGYATGATLTAIGMTAMGVGLVPHGSIARMAATMWATALLWGVAGMLVPDGQWEAVGADAAFGAGFVFAGLSLVAPDVQRYLRSSSA